MKILINYDRSEQAYLPILHYYLRNLNFQAIVTTSSLSIGELVAKAQAAGCTGIFLCNSQTLANCVPGNSPSLDDWRGSLLKFSIPTIVGNSLAHAHTIPYGSWLMEKDLRKLLLVSIHKAPPFSFQVLETEENMDIAYELLEKADFIAYDVETKTLPSTFIDNVKREGEGNEHENDEYEDTIEEAGFTIITCCSWTAVYADKTMRTYVLPLVDFLQDHWATDGEYCRAIAFLRAVNSLDIPKTMHNGMYDCTHSIIYGAPPNNWVLDTMAMAHSEFSELPKTLDFVASMILPDYCQWKSESEEASKAGDIRRYWAYNAKDTWTTARLTLHYLQNLPAYARKNYQEQFKLVYPSLYCSFEGFLIDQKVRTEIRKKELTRLDNSLASLRKMLADPKFNPGSWQQVGKYVYDILGAVDPRIGMKKTPSGKKVRITRGTDEKNLSAVGSQHPILLRVTDAIINYREARKAVSTYMDFSQKNGRLLYSLNPFGTESCRMACQSSSLWCGTQVQNIPSYAKEMLVADDGFLIGEPDLSQSEARCTAYLSQDLKLIAALENTEKDFYRTLGTLFFGIPYENVTTEFRNKILKKIVHGTNYMMGAQTFIENAGTQNLLDATESLGVKISLEQKPPKGYITLKEFANTLLESYHVPFHRVREWYQEVKNEIVTTKKLKSPLGHTRFFFGDVVKNYRAFNSAVAHAPQNLSVSVLNKGFWKLWQLVKKHNGNFRLKAQVHDSAPFQYREGKPEILLEVIEALDNPVIVHGRTLRIPTDMKVGKSWGTMNKVEKQEKME